MTSRRMAKVPRAKTMTNASVPLTSGRKELRIHREAESGGYCVMVTYELGTIPLQYMQLPPSA